MLGNEPRHARRLRTSDTGQPSEAYHPETTYLTATCSCEGISQSGYPRLRTTMIQLAWLWIRHQPGSALTVWFKDRIERNGGRRRKTTIVALVRKLLVALWKYVSAGVVIEGAMIRPA